VTRAAWIVAFFFTLLAASAAGTGRGEEEVRHHDGSHSRLPRCGRSKAAPDYREDGINLVPRLTGKAPEVERAFFWRIDRSNRKPWAVRQGKWKYLNDGNTMDLLYDLEADLSERRSLAYEHPEVVKNLKARLQSWQDEMDASQQNFVVR
jgi:arylsulfatase A-like enzyme